MSHRLDQLERLVLGALERPSNEREPYLRAACEGDDLLRAEAEALLAFEREATDFLTAPAAPRAAAINHDDDADPDVGRAIGPYRLIERIGRGGMGNVYRAEREGGEFAQTVAVKLIRRGLDTDDVLARFRAERRMLASLRHPNIAHLIDGGSTEDGRPFLVMEHVEGADILSWCDARRLSIDDRIDLVRRVCAAVSEAHRRLIVHRDLKPSNILVTATGEPKLLDFGVARVLAPEGGDTSRADVTDRASRRLTAAYASPELIAGEPTTTSTDVYSLGVILFELLTGRRPRDVGGAGPLAALDAMEREDALTKASEARGIAPAALRRSLTGDLSTIVSTALRDDPSRRYGSVEQFAEDLRRFRERLPIAARPDSWRYRAALFTRRHAGAVIGVGAAGAGLAAAIITVVAFSLRAESARFEAEAQRAVADEVNRFLGDMLAAPDPSRFGPDVTVRDVADAAAGRLARREWSFTHPQVETGVRAALGRTYLSLGLFDEAEPHLAAALAARRAEAGSAGDRSFDLVASVHDVALLRRGQARYDESLALFEEALRLRDVFPEARSPSRGEMLCNLGHLLTRRGEYDAAEARLREAAALAEREGGPDHPLVTAALDQLGTLMQRRGDLEGAEPILRRALAAARAARAKEHHDVVQSLSSLGLVVRDRGDLVEAESLLAEAVRMSRVVHGGEHPTLAVTLNNLAVLLQRAGRMDEAEPLLREALAIREARLGEDHPDTAATINSLAAMQRSRGALDDAASLYARALAILRRTLKEDHPDIATVMNNLAAVKYSMNDLEQAEHSFREVVAVRRRLLASDHPDLAIALNNLAVVLIERGAAEEAATCLREAEAIQRAKLPAGHPLLAGTLVNLGAALVDLDRAPEAEAALVEAIAIRRAPTTVAGASVGAAEALLGLALQQQGRVTDGSELLRRGVEALLAESSRRQQRIALVRIVRCSDALGLDDQAAAHRDMLARLDAAD
jgi:tetratricopeptide (TPR) repeat protein